MDSENESRREATLLKYFGILRKRWAIIATFAGALFISALVVSLISTPYYESTATLEIRPKAPSVLNMQEVSEVVDVSTPDERRAYYATQYSIIQSRTLIEEVLRRLREEHGVVEFDEVDDPVKAFTAMFSFEPEMSSFLVHIHIEHPEPETAALYANTLAHTYMDLNLKRSLEASENAFKFLTDLQTSYQETKRKSDEALFDFKVKNDLVGADERRQIIFENLEQLQQAWTKANVERVELEAVTQGSVNLARSDDWLGLANYLSKQDQVLQDRLQSLRTRQQEQAALQARYLDKHPSVQQVETEIRALELQIRRQVDEILEGLKARLQVTRDREVALKQAIEAAKVEVKELDRKLLDFNNLKAEAEKNDVFFRTLDQRRSEVDLEKVVEANNVQFVDEAIPTFEPVRPRLSRNLPVALFIGLMGGVALAFFMEYIDRTIKGPEDVEALIGVPALGPVPMLSPQDLDGLSELDRNLFVYARPKSQVAERLRDIRTNVLFRTPDHRQRRLLITSALPLEGKSFISSNLCAIIAMTGHRILLIDADLRRPTQHKLFQLDATLGLSSVLLGEATLEQAIQRTHVPNLDILVGGPLLRPSQSPAELFDSELMVEFLNSITGYDIVVIDSSPIGAVSDPLILSRLVDGVLMVVFSNQTPRDLVVQTSSKLKEMHANLLGAIVNKFDYRRSGYGYGYGYNYAYGYGYYGEDQEEAKAPPKA